MRTFFGVMVLAVMFAIAIPFANASTLVYGSYTMMCEGLSEARSTADTPSYGKMKAAVGGCENWKYKFLDPDCKQCSSGKWKCRGVASV